MVESKHTPGPWSSYDMVRTSGLPFAPVHATTLIAKVYSTAFQDDEQAIANARLMAAAPDLLKALKALSASVFVADAPQAPDLSSAIKMTIEAIKKAEGRS